MKARLIGYWVTTALLAFAILSGGAAELFHAPATAEGMLHLGYPAYFLTILGIWKVLGGLVLLAPGMPRLKEWAYAGVVFNLTAAGWSHVASGDPTWHVIATSILTGIALVSWALRPEPRRLGAILPAITGESTTISDQPASAH